MSNGKVWFFGYGSNMNSDNLTKKKGVVVHQTTPAILRGYRLEFSLAAITMAEPFFANCEKGADTDNIHGVAFETDPESVAKMDKVESGYDKASVVLEAYDGRKLSGYVYVNKPRLEPRPGGTPSRRYLQLLINGARDAGLDAKYVARLEAVKVYQPSAETLAKRAALVGGTYPAKALTREALGQDPSHYVSIFGYIFDCGAPTGFFASHRGKDITNRMVRHYLNLQLDDAADPQEATGLPNMKALEAHQDVLDYVWTWFDQYAHSTGGKLVARHAEFAAAQEPGKSSWVYPTA